MTIVFSIRTPTIIIMAVDSAVTNYFENTREYETGRKSYIYPGVGCVTTWGTRDRNRIGEYLETRSICQNNCTIENLRDLVFEYLTKEYRPEEQDFDDVGYHVGGFTKQGYPKLYHVLWGFDRPRRPEQIKREYKVCDHSEQGGEMLFLYNGRNDIAETVVHTLFNLIRGKTDTRFKFDDPPSIISFTDFVIRFGSELTPEIDLPIFIRLVTPENSFGFIRNDKLIPIDRGIVNEELRKIGYII